MHDSNAATFAGAHSLMTKKMSKVKIAFHHIPLIKVSKAVVSGALMVSGV